jgi:hypothetical protein
MNDHLYWSNALLHHYSRTWSDRQIYWLIRERATKHNDVLVCIIDSYDKAKVTLPRFPFGRTPKKPVYERIHRLEHVIRNNFPMLCVLFLLPPQNS